MSSPRLVFIEAAQQLLARGPRARYLGICGNINDLIGELSEGYDVPYRNGYDTVSALSNEYADFADYDSGTWGERGSAGDLFRYQWLRDKIAVLKGMDDVDFLDMLERRHT